MDGTLRVLVVEDEVRLAETIRRGLVSEGFVVDVEHRGDDGYHTAVSDKFDAIILDIMLPGKNGYELVRDLRAQNVWTPVLMLSAKDGEYDLADAFDLGADDYLVKPFSFVVLFARLRALVRRGAPERPAVLTGGDIELDPSRHKVTRAGTELTLTPREYSVLEFLMRHQDKVVSKGEIVQSGVGYQLRRRREHRRGLRQISTTQDRSMSRSGRRRSRPPAAKRQIAANLGCAERRRTCRGV